MTTLTWARARTLADLAELTAAWIAGTIPASPGGVVCTGPTWDQCPDCAQTVTIPDCRTAGHSWTELTAAGQSIVVCPICTQSRAAAPLALVGGARSDSYAAA